MKKLAVIAIAVCTFATFCNQEDPKTANVWPRSVEPRLTAASQWRPCRKALRTGRVVEEAECGPPAAAPAADCDAVITTHAEALQAFASQPACLDSVIAALESLTWPDPAVRSDLAAAYYVRAQRDDQPTDLLRALDAAQQATAANPSLPEALFNRALAQEALGLYTDAIASWDEFVAMPDRAEWANEARQHREKLQRERAHDAVAQWELNRARLAAALRKNDLPAVAWLIEAFPGSAQTYFEEEVLAQWGAQPSKENLAAAKTLAAALSARFGGDPYDVDVVQAIEVATQSPERLAALRVGHVTFREARNAERSYRWGKANASYARTAKLLERGGSPFQLHAQLGHAVAMAFETKGYARALPLLNPLEGDASTRGYRHLFARIRTTRAYILSSLSRHVDALAESDRALADYGRLRDEENVASLQSRRIGYLAIVGQRDRSWRQAVEQLRAATRIVELKDRHFLFGEAADSVRARGYPRVALLYQTDAIRVLYHRLNTTPTEEDDRIRRVQHNLSIALRKRANIELDTDDHTAARRDLNDAISLMDKTEDLNNLRALQTRLREVEGQAWMRNRPDRAVAAFTQALEYAGTDELRAFCAAVLVQRAEAYRRLGRANEAEHDLTAALDELRAEEAETLAQRRRGESEQLWSSYFSRSQETYRLLIRHYADERLNEDAFRYAERARAFEPLNLILQLETVPPAFRALTPGGASMTLANIRTHLPPGTFLIEYSVHADRTYTWVVSRDGFEALPVPADAAGVALWTEALQRAATQHNEYTFDDALHEPYAALIANPLAAVEKMPGGRNPNRRLVFVPDGAMHGLPIAALKNRKTGRHLIEDATVEIAGSATLYVFSLLRNAQLSSRQAPSALLIGDPSVHPQLSLVHGLGPLRGALREVARIQTLYAPHTDVRVGGLATVPEFLEQVPRHTVAHIAAHAVADAKEPRRSTLFLAPSPGHMGALDAEELLKRLQPGRTKLVVLAACSSAGGVPVGPEGVAPLVRPFLTAGVPAVIGSLWDVNDATADDLLVSFHRHYRQSSDAAVALKTAQVDMLRNRNAGRKSALAWASFQVIGH